jgi:hypothetical protein
MPQTLHDKLENNNWRLFSFNFLVLDEGGGPACGAQGRFVHLSKLVDRPPAGRGVGGSVLRHATATNYLALLF